MSKQIAPAMVAALMGLAGCPSSAAIDAGLDAGDAGLDAGTDAGLDACVDGGIGGYCANFDACICCHGEPEGVCCSGTGLECGWAGEAVCPVSYDALGCFDLWCADLNWDNQNCGTCGVVCDSTEVCGAGTCTRPDAPLTCPNLTVSENAFAALSGQAAFLSPPFAGTFSNLSDGGVDPSSLNIVVSSQDLSPFCPVPGGGGYQRPVGPYQVVFIALHSDGGAIGPGCFSSPTADGPGPQVLIFAILPDGGGVLTWRSENDADGGAIAAVIQDGGAAGVFRTILTDGDGGTSALTGSFNAPSCQGLAYVH